MAPPSTPEDLELLFSSRDSALAAQVGERGPVRIAGHGGDDEDDDDYEYDKGLIPADELELRTKLLAEVLATVSELWPAHPDLFCKMTEKIGDGLRKG